MKVESGTDVAGEKPATGKGKIKQAEYRVRLSAHENQQLIDIRTVSRIAGHRVSKTDLLRAAIALVKTQSAEAIQVQVQQLRAQGKLPRKNKR